MLLLARQPATACAFAKRGAHIGLLARGPEGLDGARKEAEACGGRAIELLTDVADSAAVGRAADAVEEKLGPIDIWMASSNVSLNFPGGLA